MKNIIGRTVFSALLILTLISIANGQSTNGIVNVTNGHFGATPDDEIDDTIAIKAAVAEIVSLGGGILFFPKGIYKVGDPKSSKPEDQLPIDLPTGITVEGINGGTGGPALGNCRLQSSKPNASIFRIGGGLKNIAIRNITLLAYDPKSNGILPGTIGVEATDTVSETTWNVAFENVTFYALDRGISVNPKSLGWQFDVVKVDHCTFDNGNIGIYVNTNNSDWQVTNTGFFMRPRDLRADPIVWGDAFHLDHAGFMLIENSQGNGAPDSEGAFVYVKGDTGPITITNSIAEGLPYFLQVEPTGGGIWGDLSYPITLINNAAGKVLIEGRRTVISTGNLFVGDPPFVAHNGTQVYSTGDRFCWDDYFSSGLGCAGDITTDSASRVVFRTGQTGQRPHNGTGVYELPSKPTRFGLDVKIENDEDFNGVLNGSNWEFLPSPLLSVIAPTNISKTLLRLGQTEHYYDFKRESTGFLSINGSQKLEDGTPDFHHIGISVNGAFKLHTLNRTTLLQISGSDHYGSLIYCSDCAETSNCSAGGGAIAKYLPSGWKCN